MNIDDTNQSFEAFEAEANGDDAPTPAPEPKKDDTLELGSDEAPVATDTDVDEDERKNRSRHPSQRINHYRAIAGDAERRAAAAEAELAKLKGQAPAEAPSLSEIEAKKPDPNQFEFGAADPDYQDALTDWKLDMRDAKARDEGKKADEARTVDEKKRAIIDKVSEGVTNIENQGQEKYEDFEKVIEAATEARGGEPLNPIISIGIAVSPVGHDVAYHLAKDPAAAEKLERIAETSPQAAAVALGEIEGQYVDSDDDLDLSDGMDMARMLGRMKSRLAGKGVQATTERKVTRAPEPPEHKSRGSNGQFETKGDTENFEAFEAMANKQDRSRR